MNGKSLIVDTNILIYLLDGDETIKDLLDDKHLFVSFITYIELFSYQKLSLNEEKIIRELLASVTVLHTTDTIIEKAVDYRKDYNLKIPDSLIAATSKAHLFPLFTADFDFEKIEDLNLIIYDHQ